MRYLQNLYQCYKIYTKRQLFVICGYGGNKRNMCVVIKVAMSCRAACHHINAVTKSTIQKNTLLKIQYRNIYIYIATSDFYSLYFKHSKGAAFTAC